MIVLLLLLGCINHNSIQTKCSDELIKVISTIEIVDIPEFGVITNQIPKSLIGRYVKRDPDEYFEIRNDGTFTFSLRNEDYYYDEDEMFLVYTEQEIDLVAYYIQDKYCYLEFQLGVGTKGTFGRDQISYKFFNREGDVTNALIAKYFYGGDGYLYVREEESLVDLTCIEYTMLQPNIEKAEVVDIPPFDTVTNKVSRNLVGRYNPILDDEKDTDARYFVIRDDGTFTINLLDEITNAYFLYTERDMNLFIFYGSNKTCILEFRLKPGFLGTVYDREGHFSAYFVNWYWDGVSLYNRSSFEDLLYDGLEKFTLITDMER